MESTVGMQMVLLDAKMYTEHSNDLLPGESTTRAAGACSYLHISAFEKVIHLPDLPSTSKATGSREWQEIGR